MRTCPLSCTLWVIELETYIFSLTCISATCDKWWCIIYMHVILTLFSVGSLVLETPGQVGKRVDSRKTRHQLIMIITTNLKWIQPWQPTTQDSTTTLMHDNAINSCNQWHQSWGIFWHECHVCTCLWWFSVSLFDSTAVKCCWLEHL